MRTFLLLFTMGALAAGTYGLQRSSAAPSGGDPESRGSSATGLRTTCENCSSGIRYEGGGTCPACKPVEKK